ncbi:MAG TPA: isoaspartyl peptidase/L-asparaginase [Actinomycetota bacterium]|nr:isoaspartyl peptidase/L-asparaginase [Actinomycetota bacterium]
MTQPQPAQYVTPASRPPNFVIVHGGVAGTLKESQASLDRALPESLTAASALDAVELAVAALEDDPLLNAGYGSVLDREGRLEMDAGIADGSTGRAAGVANVTVRHPITLARRVLEQTPHVFIAGRGAMELGAGMEILEDSTPAQRARWDKARAEGVLAAHHFGDPEYVDTVGSVALDAQGRLAAGSSTGGVFGKMTGRVGDAPIFGAGIYASEAVAVVGTGVGELFLLTLASLRAGRLVEEGAAPQAACEQTIEFLGSRQKVSAGLLALDRESRWGAAYRGASWQVSGPHGPLDPVCIGGV